MGTHKQTTNNNETYQFSYYSWSHCICKRRSCHLESHSKQWRSEPRKLIKRRRLKPRALIKQRKLKPRKFTQPRYQIGMNSWFGWYVTAIVDASADLVTDVVSDVSEWGTDAAESIDSYVEGLTNDVGQFIDGAIQDVGDWGGHLNEGEFSEVADDLHDWIQDV